VLGRGRQLVPAERAGTKGPSGDGQKLSLFCRIRFQLFQHSGNAIAAGVSVALFEAKIETTVALWPVWIAGRPDSAGQPRSAGQSTLLADGLIGIGSRMWVVFGRIAEAQTATRCARSARLDRAD